MSADRSLRPIVGDACSKMLSRVGIVNSKGLVDKTEMHLQELLDISWEEANAIRSEFEKKLAAKPSTALDLFLRSKKRRRIVTGLRIIDESLAGGIPCGSVTEIVGNSGIGKSQFCLTLTAQQCLFQEKSNVVYLDTENKFSSARLLEILTSDRWQSSRDANSTVRTDLNRVLNRVRVLQPESSKELLRTLQGLEKLVIEHDVGLIVLDSMAFHVLNDFDSSQIPRRQALLGSMASILKWIAETFSLPVVVTNHGRSDDGLSQPRAALGTAWSHCVNTRFLLSEDPMGRRSMVVAKSPIAGPVAAGYRICSEGFVPDDPPVCDVSPSCI